MSRRITDVGAPLPRRRAVRLLDERDARRLLAKICTDLYRSEIGPERAGKIIYAVSVFLRSVETERAWKSEGAASEKMSPEEFSARVRSSMREASETIPLPTGREGEGQG